VIHWAWLIPYGFVCLTLGVLLLAVCAAAAIDGAERNGYERGVEVGKVLGYAAAMRDTDPAVREAAGRSSIY
jgi:hypothetical protein